MNGAIYVSDSGNVKIIGSQKADATYASIEASCPDSCVLKANGCYAQDGRVAIHVRRLDVEARGDIVKAEVRAIDGSYRGGRVPKGRSLRLHVSGDARTTRAARSLSAAVRRWQARGGGVVWSYTHAWRDVKRAAWGTVNVLASIENPRLAAAARRQGYTPALVVERHSSAKAYVSHGVRWIPCPQQTRGVG